MRYPRIAAKFSLMAALGAGASSLAAQSLADRVARTSEPRVQFSYSARAGVCGNGRSFISVGGNQWYGSFNDADRRETCAEGPIRVVLDRAGREVISIRSYAGPLPDSTPGIVDLGRVASRDAADYLLGLAERAEGRVSRDAIMPAALAEGADVTARLLAIARNQNAARATRTSAISWVGRPFDSRERAVRDIANALVQIARDDSDNEAVRKRALSTLAQLEHGAGTTALMELGRDAGRGWTAREALAALRSSGDPRARPYLREVVRRSDLPDDVLAAAIRGVGGEFATGEDVKLLRDVYGKLPGQKSREGALSAIATFGGTENVRWLLALARDGDIPVQTRRRAIQHAHRGGASVADIIKVYDETTEPQLKDAVITVLVGSGERPATDKLMQIARNDGSAQMRRKAVSGLSKSSDERVKKFLSDLAER